VLGHVERAIIVGIGSFQPGLIEFTARLGERAMTRSNPMRRKLKRKTSRPVARRLWTF
jgi:hypothetical protein